MSKIDELILRALPKLQARANGLEGNYYTFGSMELFMYDTGGYYVTINDISIDISKETQSAIKKYMSDKSKSLLEERVAKATAILEEELNAEEEKDVAAPNFYAEIWVTEQRLLRYEFHAESIQDANTLLDWINWTEAFEVDNKGWEYGEIEGPHPL